MNNINEKALAEARKWDTGNPAMEPVEVPCDCKAVYRYQQPVVQENPKGFPKDSHTQVALYDGWYVVTVVSSHVMTPQEKGEYQEELRKCGGLIVGNLRMTSQTFSRDEDAISIKDLGNMFGEE